MDEASASLPPTSSSCPVSIPNSLPHQLTVPRLGTMAPGLEVDSPGGIGSSRQQVGAAAQEVVVVPVEGAVVEAGPGGTGGRGTRALAPELGHGPREGLQEGWRGRATWRTCTTVSICVWGRRAEEAGCGRTGMVTLVGRDREGTHLKGQELHVGAPVGEAGDSLLSGGGPPGSCWLEQLRQAWERPSLQLCPQGRAQHSSRLPTEALAEPVPGWHCRVAKQWPPGVASARAMVGRGGKK